MGRPRELEEAKMVPIILDRETRKIIEQMKGDGGISRYVRRLIREQDPKASQQGDAKTLVLRKDLRAMEAELESYRRKEKIVTKEKAEAMAYIAKGLELYKSEDMRRADDPETCRRWIEARCRGSGILTSEFLSFHQNRK